MESVLIEALKGQGIWTICTVALTLYVLKTTGERELRSLQREDKLQELIAKLTEKFNLIEDVKNNIQEVKEDVEEIKGKLK